MDSWILSYYALQTKLLHTCIGPTPFTIDFCLEFCELRFICLALKVNYCQHLIVNSLLMFKYDILILSDLVVSEYKSGSSGDIAKTPSTAEMVREDLHCANLNIVSYPKRLFRRELFVPRTRTTMATSRSVAVIGPSLWNRLPPSVRASLLSSNLSTSLSLLKTCLYSWSWSN